MKNALKVLIAVFLAVPGLPVSAWSQAPNPLIRLEERFEFKKLAEYLDMVERHGSDQVPARYLRALLEKDGPQALAIYQDVVSRDSLGIYADRALWRIAQYYFISGDYRQAYAALADLVNRYPNSEFLPKAQDQMSRISRMGTQPALPPVSTVPSTTPMQTSGSAEPARGKFTIQAGAFSSPDNAEFMKRHLLDLGFGDTYIKKGQVGDKPVYMVWVGNYVSRDDAERQRRQLGAKIGNIQFFIKVIP